MTQKTTERPRVNFRFREELNKVLAGVHHNYCYQCGACVSVCPAERYTHELNPRQVLLMALLGLEDRLLSPDSPIWKCTNCYSCYERCPQDARPIEVIIALKNMAAERGIAPPEIVRFSENIGKTGVSATITERVTRMRRELGLGDMPEVPLEELKEILEE